MMNARATATPVVNRTRFRTAFSATPRPTWVLVYFPTEIGTDPAGVQSAPSGGHTENGGDALLSERYSTDLPMEARN